MTSSAKQSRAKKGLDCFVALAPRNDGYSLLQLPPPVLYDIYHPISDGSRHDRPDRAIDSPPRRARRPPRPLRQIAVLAALAATGTLATNILLPSLPQMAASLKVSSAAVTSAITVFLAVFALGQLVVGPISDRYGRRWPVLAGFAVFLAGSIWCGLANDLPSLLTGRVIQARRRLRDLGAVARHRPRSVLRRGAGARDGADHDRDGGSARLLAAARRRARSLFRLARRIRLCRGVRGHRARSPMKRCSAKPIMRRGPRSIRSRSPKTISASSPIAASWFRPRPSA